MKQPFEGAKLALYIGVRLAVILRDDIDGIPFPGHWDMPGGGREGEEDPLSCALRETHEELGLTIPPRAVKWGHAFDAGSKRHWLFVARVSSSVARHVVLGAEGQCWALMDEASFLTHPKAIPLQQGRLREYLDTSATSEKPPAALSGGR